MPVAPTPTTTIKPFMPVRLVKFMVFHLRIRFVVCLFRRVSMVLSASVATIRHRSEPRLRLEIAAMRVVRIERRGNPGMPRLERGQDRRQDDERGAGSAEGPADHRPPKRRTLLSALA